MTSSPEPGPRDRAAAAGAVVDVAAVQARLPPRAAADARGVRAVAARRAARRAARAVADAARRGRARAATPASCARPRSASACRPRRPGSSRTVSTRVQRRFRDKVTIALESHVARLQASVATIAHQERPEYLDRLVDAAQPGVRARPHVHVAVLHLRLDPAARRHDRAAGVDPSRRSSLLARVRAADRADLDVAARRSSAPRRSAARRRNRLARHLFTLATTAPPGKEVRVTGIGERLVDGAARGVGALVRAGGGRALGLGAVAHAGVGDLRRRATSARSCSCRRASARRAGDVLLVLAAGARLSAYIGATVGEIGFLRGFWMDGSRRLAWLEDYAASLVARGRSAGARSAAPTASASSTCRSPIPAPSRLVLDDVIADAARRRGRRDRRRERRRQDDAGQAAREDVRADVGRDPRRRHAARAHAGRRVARAAGRRVPGLLPLRVPRAPHGRRRRRAAAGRRAGRGRGRRARRRRRRRRAAAVGPRHAARPDVARRRRGVVRPVAEARARARLHARRAAAAGARRADRRARRRDRARAVRALRRGRARRRRAATAGSRSSCRTASRPCAWPT